MPRPTIDVTGPEYQDILKKRDMHRRYGVHAKDMIRAEETMARLEKKSPSEGYTDQERAEVKKIKEIYARVFAKAERNDAGTAEGHMTPYYIWHTRGDDKVRPEHAANNGKVFSWKDKPPTGHPGEDYGCRCWAEPFIEGAFQEWSSQVVMMYTKGSLYTWSDADLMYHYFNGNGRGLLLGDIGLLSGVIDYAKIHPQKSGGSIFDRVARKIFVTARKNGAGSFRVGFGTSYNFKDFLFSFGDSTVEGDSDVHVQEDSGFLRLSATIHYTFWDQYKDPLDTYDVIPGTFELPGGKPYNITDAWMVKLKAFIKKDGKKSIYPDDEFGSL